MKRFLSIFLISILIWSAPAVFIDNSHADSTNNWMFYGSDCTSNKTAASAINYIFAKYPNGSQWQGDGQCYGYALKISSILAAKQKEEHYGSLKLTKKNFLKKCKGVKAGTHIRLSTGPENSGAWGHSVVLLKVTNKKVYWTEANVRGYNNIRHYCASPEKFINLYDFTHLNYAIKTVSYRTRTTPLLDGERNGKGQYRLYWTKTKNTEKYKVYRATSKNGTYRCIKETTKCNYTDTKAKKGTRYYYKVKAVKETGKVKTSGKVSYKRS